jgi:hypothetical protein
MADPVGMTASIIAIAGLAYQSGKTLYELLNGIQNAPRTLQALNEDLSAIQQLLKSIKSAMEDSSDNSFSNGVKKCLEEAKPALAATLSWTKWPPPGRLPRFPSEEQSTRSRTPGHGNPALQSQGGQHKPTSQTLQ